jgi:hypothetical protein
MGTNSLLFCRKPIERGATLQKWLPSGRTKSLCGLVRCLEIIPHSSISWLWPCMSLCMYETADFISIVITFAIQAIWAQRAGSARVILCYYGHSPKYGDPWRKFPGATRNSAWCSRVFSETHFWTQSSIVEGFQYIISFINYLWKVIKDKEFRKSTISTMKFL